MTILDLDMIDHLKKHFCIDTSRIYANGMSNGGGFSLNILACNSSATAKIAAFAANSGAYYQDNSSTNCKPDTVANPCNPGRKNVPILEVHGSADDTIPYAGGGRRDRCLPSIPHFVQAWAVLDGLSSTNTSTPLANGNVKKQTFGDGLVTHYWVSNLMHSWASTASGSYHELHPNRAEFLQVIQP
jgi:poly(3-hydroxybutyrate) depolymerase